MWPLIFASLLALPLVSAERIVTVCRNTYGTGDFLIQVIPLTRTVFKRQESAASGYLDSSGLIAQDCQQGSAWSLNNAQLSSNGLKVSVAKSFAFARFSTSALLSAENTKFATTSDLLFWDNPDFQSGTARFCASTAFNSALTAVFSGALPLNCVQATLRTVPVSSCRRLNVSSSTGSTASVPTLSIPSIINGTEKGKPLNVSTAHIGTSHPVFTASVTSHPTITGFPSPSQNISSSISNGTSLSTSRLHSSVVVSHFTENLTDISHPSVTGFPAPSHNISSSSLSGNTSLTHSRNPSISVFPASGNAASHTYGTGTKAMTKFSSNSSTMVGATGNSTAMARTSASSHTGLPNLSSGNAFRSMGHSSTNNFSFSSTSRTMISKSSSSVNSSKPIPFPSSISKGLTANSFATSTPAGNSSLKATSTSHSSSIPPFRLASSLIDTNPRFISWCSSYLQYSSATSQVTVTLGTTVSIVTSATVTPEIATTTILIDSTTISTVVTPFETTTVDVTPSTSIDVLATAVDTLRSTTTVTSTTNDFSQVIQKRQITHSTSAITIPSKLQTFQPSVISSACSANVPSPSPVSTTTMTKTFTKVNTHYATAPHRYYTVDVHSEHEVGITVKSGDYETTETETPHTYTYTITTTTTKKLDSTATITKTNTVPSVILAHPTAIVGSVNGSSMDYDDFAYNLTIPFEMQMYGNSTNKIWVSTNGLLSLYTGSWYYNNAQLPRAFPIPNYCIFPFWDDTYIYKDQPQGIYYEVTGDGDGTRIALEFYLSHYHGVDQYYHYTVSYDSASPGMFIVKYYQVSDNGTSATVGMQQYDANKFTQVSFDTPDIYPGLELTMNTNTGVIGSSYFDASGNTTSDTG